MFYGDRTIDGIHHALDALEASRPAHTPPLAACPSQKVPAPPTMDQLRVPVEPCADLTDHLALRVALKWGEGPQSVSPSSMLLALYSGEAGRHSSLVATAVDQVHALVQQGPVALVLLAANPVCGDPLLFNSKLAVLATEVAAATAGSSPLVILLSSCSRAHGAHTGSSGSADLSEDAPVNLIKGSSAAAEAQQALLAAEQIVRSMPAGRILRCGDIIGPSPHDLRTRLTELEPEALQAAGMDGSEPLYCVHMDDVANCVVQMINKPGSPPQSNLFGPVEAVGVGYTVAEVLAHVADKHQLPRLGWPESPIRVGPLILTCGKLAAWGWRADFGVANGRMMERHPLQRAAAGLPVQSPPVWLMRQAGRYLPEYKKIMEGKQFFDVIEKPSLAAEITLQPVLRYKLDAAIIFTDILIIPQAMGMPCTLVPGKGPVFDDPLREPQDMSRLNLTPDPYNSSLRKALDGITKSVELLHQLPDRDRSEVTMIGFCGAPWTLFVYMIEGSAPRAFMNCKRWIYRYPAESKQLLKALTHACASFLIAQYDSGAQALEVFDSHAAQLPPAVYREFGLPGLLEIAELVRAARPEATLMGLAKDATHVLADLQSSAFDVVALGQMSDPTAAREAVPTRCLMGNLDPGVLFAEPEAIRTLTHATLDALGGESCGRGLIANLGHGVDMHTPVEGVAAFVEAVRDWVPPVKQRVVIGSRKSKLAMVQAVWVQNVLSEAHPQMEFVIKEVVSTGDKILGVPLSMIGDTGLFTKQLEIELLARSIDLAVHSLKDVETALHPGLLLEAYSEREDPSDLLVLNPTRKHLHHCRAISDLPQGAIVGTSSLRRQVQLRRLRPDLVLRDIRGNVQLRLAKLAESYDAVVMAAAGFQRLGLLDDPDMAALCHPVPEEEMLYAVGQAALAVECREADLSLRKLIRSTINHAETELCVCTERQFLRSLGGGCQVPLGVHCALKDGKLKLRGAVFSLDGTTMVTGTIEGVAADEIGLKLAEQLRLQGADAVIEQVRATRKAEGHTY